MVKPISTKIQKISQVWWYVPIVPSIWEAEAGESLNSEGGGCSEPGNRARLCLKKKKD